MKLQIDVEESVGDFNENATPFLNVKTKNIFKDNADGTSQATQCVLGEACVGGNFICERDSSATPSESTSTDRNAQQVSAAEVPEDSFPVLSESAKTGEAAPKTNVDEVSEMSMKTLVGVVPDDIEDLLEEVGVASPLLEMHANWENYVMHFQAEEQRYVLPAPTREIAQTFLWCLCRNGNVPGFWPEAVTLFDAYCARRPQKAQDSLPATCVAVVRSLILFEDRRSSICSSTLIDPESIAGLAQSGFHCSPDAIVQESKVQLRCLMKAMECNLKVPTLQSWVTAYAQRLNVCVRFKFAVNLQWACSKAMAWSQRIFTQQSLVNEQPQRHIAAGLFALSLMEVGLISVHSLRPACLDAAQWEGLILQSGGGWSVPESALSHDDAMRLLTMLEFATSCTVKQLQVGTCAALRCAENIFRVTDNGAFRT